ncbi:hypothetical protein JHK87_017165 [Glycine soja]|nr:hypothetical protein JHK87_017165 [Glycine soja]
MSQLWEIEDFERKNGCYRVCLNYCGYITQRFIVNASQSNIIISNTLNDVNIRKITSSLLINFLGVVEEVQSAWIEIRNLVEAKFFSHSVQRLYLQLSFIDFYSGRKVKLTFDITCLKCMRNIPAIIQWIMLSELGTLHPYVLVEISLRWVMELAIHLSFTNVLYELDCQRLVKAWS